MTIADGPIELAALGVPALDADALGQRVREWEGLLELLVDPEHPRVEDRERKRRMLSFLLERAGLDEERFWKLTRGQRGRLFLSRYSRHSRDVPSLEITSFDLDKAAKERFRREPLTLGAAWHFGFWRSYFSHAAITHPANDGLREEFSTAWDIARREPAVLFRTARGADLLPIDSLVLDLPMIVGPLPQGDGRTSELAYLRAIERADPLADRKTRSLVIVEADRLLEHADAYSSHVASVMPRLERRHLEALERDEAHPLAELLNRARIVELVWHDEFSESVASLRRRFPALMFSVFLPHDPDPGRYFTALERAVRTDGVAMVQIHSGQEKSYRLVPEVDRWLKAHFLRARIQLVNAGGDTDTQASAATVYESVLLGTNGGAMTHIACLALQPELVDVYHGADAAPLAADLADRDPEELTDLAENTLVCWQHSVLDFLSCMGIDDIHKTSGNTMAITVTEDWTREVDTLATDEFGHANKVLNDARIAAEPIPEPVRERYRPSTLLREVRRDLPQVLTARSLADESASWHLHNSNRNLTADFLEVIYKMAAGELPTDDDFFLTGDMGLGSIDEVRVGLSRESLAWSLERLRRDPSLLDYVSLAVPRGFLRPGAAPPRAELELRRVGTTLATFNADAEGGYRTTLGGLDPDDLPAGEPLRVVARDPASGETSEVLLVAEDHGASGKSVLRASADGRVVLTRDPRGGLRLVGQSQREPIWQGPVGHASISLGSASEDLLVARIEGNAGLAFTSSGEGGPIRLEAEGAMAWESLQAASAHFGLTAADLRQVRDVEIKINQGAKPGKGGRLAGHKVTPQVSRARNIPAGIDALSPDPKHDIYSIEDMPAEVWLWLLYRNHCGIKISGSNYTRYVAAGMWSNFVVDYLLVDSGIGGSGNYHADSSHVGWPDILRTILHTHHALVSERVDLAGTGELRPLRDGNGVTFGASGGTRLFASGGLRGELDILKVLIAGADGVVEASIGKAVAFGCNQCGNCHLDCPRGGITTKAELTVQNERDVMRRRFRNWTVLNLVKLAVLIDALNRESGALDAKGEVARPAELIDDIRELRGRTDLLSMPVHAPRDEPERGPEAERDSCRVGSLAVSEPVTVHAVWEAARLSHNGGNNRGGGIGFAGFTPPSLREATCLVFNTIGPDRDATLRSMLSHLRGCRPFDSEGRALEWDTVRERLGDFRIPVRDRYAGEAGWREAGLREDVGDFHLLFVELDREVGVRYGRSLLASAHWLQRRTKYGDLPDEVLVRALESGVAAAVAEAPPAVAEGLTERLEQLTTDVREEYFTALAHLLDTRYYKTFGPAAAPADKYAAKRSGYLVSMGENLAAIKISGWTHTIPEYFDLDRFWASYPGAAELGGVEIVLRGRKLRTTKLYAHVWGMHHRYPTNSPAVDEEGRGNPAGAHPFKAYNVLLKHNGEQVAVDSTAPFLCEYGYVHADESMGAGAVDYEGDSYYERKALTDTEYAAYLVDFTRRVLGLTTEEASQVISPITGIDLEAMDDARKEKLRLLMRNYIQLTPTGPYKFTIIESLRRGGERVVGFRENMDIKFLRPHEIVSHRDRTAGGAEAVANGSEAKIADSMLRILHQQGVLKDPACDLRFNMRQGGKPGLGEHGGVFEAFVWPRQLELQLVNRFDEDVPVPRAGFRSDLSVTLAEVSRLADLEWMHVVDDLIEECGREAVAADVGTERRTFEPDDSLSRAAARLVQLTLERGRTMRFHDYRYLVESALPGLARSGDACRALALRTLTELRKRLAFADLGRKALSSLEYLTIGGRAAEDRVEGGVYRVLDEVPELAEGWGRSRYLRIGADTRDDMVGPADAARDVLVICLAGFTSEEFTTRCASRFVTHCVQAGWRNLIGYDARGGPRYLATNLAGRDGTRASDVVLELYGREMGDFAGALLEGARIYHYGQAQSHVGFKADSGYVFVLQDALNTCMYAAHGGTFSVWDSGSRFAVAGQNKVYESDGLTFAPGFRSIHFGTPNEYAFEYLMSGGENSLHVVLGLRKPDARGELTLRPKPYAGKFLMSGAAAGRVVLLDPNRRLDPAQHVGNVPVEISGEEWAKDLAPFLTDEARRRGAPIRIEGETFQIKLDGAWRAWHYADAFVKLVPAKLVQQASQAAAASPDNPAAERTETSLSGGPGR